MLFLVTNKYAFIIVLFIGDSFIESEIQFSYNFGEIKVLFVCCCFFVYLRTKRHFRRKIKIINPGFATQSVRNLLVPLSKIRLVKKL